MKKFISKQIFFSLLLVFCMLFQSISFAFANDVNDTLIPSVNEESSDIVIDKDNSSNGEEYKISEESIKDDSKDEISPRTLVNEVESGENSEIPKMLQLLEVKSSESSKDLNRFLKSFEFEQDGVQQNPDGSYTIDPGKNYSVKLKFEEDEKLQFDDTDEMKYTFPDGVKIVDAGPGTFDIKIVDSQGEATISGNEFEFKDNSVIVKFNKNDPNYPRLSAVGNASFGVSLKVKFAKKEGEYEFAPGVIKKFVFETNSDLEIKKAGVYNKDTDNVDYILTIKSVGTNNEVVIKDDIQGTALKYNKDVKLQNSIGETIVNNEGGFEIKIPKLEDEQEVVVKYSAKVLYDKLKNNGTVDNTKNIASVKSDEIKTPKEVQKHLENQINIKTLLKKSGENIIDEGNGIKTVPWIIKINEENKKLDLSNVDILDELVGEAKNRAKFTGEGITVIIDKGDNNIVTKKIKWKDITDIKGNALKEPISNWKYTLPNDTGKAYVKIEAQTSVDTNNLFGDMNIKNKVSVKENIAEANKIFKAEGIGEDKKLTAKKEAIKITDKEIEWKIKIHVVKEGYSNLRFVDDFPNIKYQDKRFYDKYIKDSVKIEGLLDGEKYKINPPKEEDENDFTKQDRLIIDFGKLNPIQDEKGRDIIITLKTRVNQELLDIVHEKGYENVAGAEVHKNVISATVEHAKAIDIATAIPKKRSITKDVVEQSSEKIDNISYPIFGYEVILSGVSQEPTEVIDKFNTEYLKLYEVEGIEIIPMENEDGKIKIENSEIESTQEGIKINIKKFPKVGNKFYNNYKLKYTLIAKDKDTLEKMKEEAKKNNGVLKLENTATWDNVESDKNTAICNYAPFVGKEQAVAPSAGNKYKATFKVVVNEHATKLDPNNSTFDVVDELSNNLRLIPSSIKIDPDNLGINVGVDGNKITFKNVPDETKVVIVYEVEVLGAAGDIEYYNTIKLGKYQAEVHDIVTKEISGGGSGSNPSITLVKTDKDDINKHLSGAEFQLFRVNQGNEEPVVDKNNENVTFTTKDNGKVLIEGDKDKLGWVLWTGVEYHLKEIKAPKGYNLRTELVKFILKEQPTGGIEYEYIGKELNNVTNERPKIDIEANKNWVNGPSDRPDVWFKLYRQLEGNPLEEVTEASIKKLSSGTTKVKWEGMYSHNLEMKPYKFVVKEVNADGSDFTPENYKKDGDGNENNHYTIKNTYESPKIEITGIKIWEHGPQTHPTIKLQLYRNGQKLGEPVELPNGKTSHKWTNLDKTDVNGVDYEYKVDEVDVPDNYNKTNPDALTVKNTYVSPNTDITATKIWEGGTKNKPEIWFKLYRNIEGGNSEEVSGIAIQKLENGTDKVTWKGLPETDTNGNKYIYTVKEVDADGKDYEPKNYKKSEEGLKVTNKFISPKVTREVTKEWIGAKADSIKVKLLADGKEIKEIELSNLNNWKHTFEGLDKYAFDDGHEILYSFKEAGEENGKLRIGGKVYDVSYTGNKIINKEHVEETNIGKDDLQESRLPRTGDSNLTTISAIAIASIAAILIAYDSKRKYSKK